MRLQEKLAWCNQSGRALLAANFYNYETLKGVLAAARAAGSGIILQLSESTIDYLGVHTAIGLARAGMKDTGVQGWVHLDHGGDISLIKKCLEAGFDSVMIDASEKPLKENIAITRAVVRMASAYNANVEAELGYVAKLGQEQKLEYTRFEDAKVFVEQTGVNALAVAIGSAHGRYKHPPALRIDILKEIHAHVPAALVLHGGSGIPPGQIQAAIRNGISKVNVATETKHVFMRSLKELLRETQEIDLRQVFPAAIDQVKDLIVNKLNIINSSGREKD